MIHDKEIIVYIDDILIASKTVEEHLEIITKVLKKIVEYGLEIKLNKCSMLQKEIGYLGYIANEKGIRPNDEHISTIRNYPIPKSTKELNSCLGLFSYFRRFVPNFSRIAAPMLNLLKKESIFDFNKDCERAFYTLKHAISSSPVLAIFSREKETELHTDASMHGYGAILLQKQNDNKWHPISFFSKRATATEAKYHSFELETLAIVYAIRRFHQYLSGLHFTIVTDCNALSLTLEKKTINPRIARWALELEGYDYEITHRKGTNMPHVDALSRNFVCTLNENEVDVQLQITQSRDSVIQKIREQLELGPVNSFALRNGLVYRKMSENHYSLYVPTEMQYNVIQLIHEKIGHLSVENCYLALKTHYWFPNMKEKIDKFIKCCIKCIMYKKPHRKIIRDLHSIPKEPIPFHTVHADLCGPLPSINSKKKHILVVTDAFTKHSKLYAVTATSTKEVIICLNKYFEYYSRPTRMITDRGSCFTSLEFSEYLANNNITHHKVATNSPQANGQVERMNRILAPMLGKLSEPFRQSDWAQLLPKTEYAMNNHINKSTKFTPSILLFGIPQKGPNVDELTEYLQEKNNPANPSERKINEIRSIANANIIHSQQKNEAQHKNISISPPKYKLGEFVVIRNNDTTAGVNKKLSPKYKGPYKITAVLPHDRYIVSDLDTFQVSQIPYNGTLEAANIKLWKPCDDNSNSLLQ